MLRSRSHKEPRPFLVEPELWHDASSGSGLDFNMVRHFKMNYSNVTKGIIVKKRRKRCFNLYVNLCYEF
jgi:hypothetical protein